MKWLDFLQILKEKKVVILKLGSVDRLKSILYKYQKIHKEVEI